MATLKVKIQEDIILDNQDYSSKRTLEIGSINEISKRIVTVPADGDTVIASFKSATSVADGAFDIQDVKYIRLTNLDSSNSVNLNLLIDDDENDASHSESAIVILEAGKSFIMGSPHDSIAVFSSTSVDTNFYDLESIMIDSGSNAVNIEVIIASA
mgnify:CR=1 FL=1|tara:strand:- start:32 stop:499 length:468 start_codon:yes stop_codon:yes gene_type:complete